MLFFKILSLIILGLFMLGYTKFFFDEIEKTNRYAYIILLLACIIPFVYISVK